MNDIREAMKKELKHNIKLENEHVNRLSKELSNWSLSSQKTESLFNAIAQRKKNIKDYQERLFNLIKCDTGRDDNQSKLF